MNLNIKKFCDIHKGKRVICVGNGPSLKKQNISLLDDEIVIGTNRAYKIFKEMNPACEYLVVQDKIRYEEMKSDLKTISYPIYVTDAQIDALKCSILQNAFKIKCARKWNCHIRKLRLSRQVDYGLGFSDDLERKIFPGYSVIFPAIQLAAYLGASRVAMIGVDMDYSGTVSFFDGVKHIWPNFSYEKHCKDMMIYFREHMSERGIEFVNCSAGGVVEEIPRMTLEEFLL